MDTKTCPKRLPERKTQNVSKPRYLLCFNHILILPSALEICLFSSKILPWLPWPSFGPQGVLNKPLGWHLQTILGIPGPPWSPRASPESPKRVPKIIQNHFLSLVFPWGVPGMPPGSPTDPKKHQKCHKNTNNKKGTVAALRAALLDNISMVYVFGV